jgi:serine/threonine-protein kinase PknK
VGATADAATFLGYADLVEIGSGAFASVYRATELNTGRPVALKLLKLSALLPHVLEAFDREVKALGAVGAHPNIVTLYRTLTTLDGRPVLVLELCKGSMADRVRQQGPLPAAETVSVGIKIAGALETAHRAGLLHRDMKPQNILITQYGEPALADFGVAALQASAQATEGVFGFTTLHAPPEVLEGGQLSPATDVYGLASSIYQLIAGRAPFAAFDGEAPASVILRILRDPVTPLRLEQVPLELSDLLQMALAKAPEERPATAAAFAEALRQVEQSCGWPASSYAVWGDASAAASAASPSAPVERRSDSAAQPQPLPVTPPSLPPLTSPNSPGGPGIVTPAAAARKVVSPNSPPARPAAPPTPPRPSPPSSPPSSPPAERPIFVDPPVVPPPTPRPPPPSPPPERPVFVDPPAVPPPTTGRPVAPPLPDFPPAAAPMPDPSDIVPRGIPAISPDTAPRGIPAISPDTAPRGIPAIPADTPPRGQPRVAPPPGPTSTGRRVGRRQPDPPPSPVWTTPPSPSGWGVAEGPYDQTLTHRGLTAQLRASLDANPPIPNPVVPNHRKGFISAGAAGLVVVALVIVICILTGAV